LNIYAQKKKKKREITWKIVEEVCASESHYPKMLAIIPVIFWLLEGKDEVEEFLLKLHVLFYTLLMLADEPQEKREWK